MSTERRTNVRTLVELLGPLWSERRVCERLGITPLELEDLHERRQVISTPDGAGVVRYPVFQFRTTTDEVSLNPIIAVALGILAGMDELAVATLLNIESAELDELTPMEWDRVGLEAETVVRYFMRLDSDWKQGTDPAYRVRRRRLRARRSGESDGLDEVDELLPTSNGLWFVTTRVGRYMLDLDDNLISRVPNEQMDPGLDYDLLQTPIVQIVRYPQVGHSALIWVSDSQGVGGFASWRVLVDVQSIRRAGPTPVRTDPV